MASRKRMPGRRAAAADEVLWLAVEDVGAVGNRVFALFSLFVSVYRGNKRFDHGNDLDLDKRDFIYKSKAVLFQARLI
jgi:hypothetical protein